MGKHGPKGEPTTMHGYCHDCAQGILIPVDDGFAQYMNDEGKPEFWYCRFCGSNHVILKNEDGSVAYRQGDLYAPGGWRRNQERQEEE